MSKEELQAKLVKANAENKGMVVTLNTSRRKRSVCAPTS